MQLNTTTRHAAAFITTKGVDTAKRQIEAIVSSDTIDRYGEIIDQGSWRLDAYLRNPVVLAHHDHADPIGKTVALDVRDGALHATMQLANTPRASEILQLFADGALRAFSVGFRVGRIVSEQVDGVTRSRLVDSELWEISAVAIPANPDAVVKMKALGLVPPGYQLGDASGQLDEIALRAAGFDRTGDSIVEIARRAVDRGDFDGPEAA